MHKPDTFSVGWSRIDITPTVPTPLDGMGHDYERQANWVEPQGPDDHLKASLILIADGVAWENSVLFCAMDTLFIHELFSAPAAKAVADAIGIYEKNVFFCGSHTHSGVSMDEPDPSVTDYLDWLYPALAEAAKEAAADLAPARLQIGSLETTGMNAQRRYILKDGTHRSTVHDKTYTSQDILGYETRTDHTLRAIRFARTDKPDILLSNWQMHPGFTASVTQGRVSADIFGTVREMVEATDPNVRFAFFQGAAGNMGRSTRWQEDPWYDKMKSFDRESYAREFTRLLLEEIHYENAAAGQLRVSNLTLTVHQKQGKTVLEQTYDLPVNAVSFGDVALCTAPAEMFSDSGLALRENSPFKMTFLSTCTNGNYGYLPVKACFEGESYTHINEQGDSFEVRVSKCQPGTAELIVEALTEALRSQKLISPLC